MLITVKEIIEWQEEQDREDGWDADYFDYLLDDEESTRWGEMSYNKVYQKTSLWDFEPTEWELFVRET